jgi:hypothetical protein
LKKKEVTGVAFDAAIFSHMWARVNNAILAGFEYYL